LTVRKLLGRPPFVKSCVTSSLALWRLLYPRRLSSLHGPCPHPIELQPPPSRPVPAQLVPFPPLLPLSRFDSGENLIEHRQDHPFFKFPPVSAFLPCLHTSGTVFFYNSNLFLLPFLFPIAPRWASVEDALCGTVLFFDSWAGLWTRFFPRGRRSLLLSPPSPSFF